MYKVQQGQILGDIALQLTGRIDNWFTLAIANGKSITEELVTGSEIILPIRMPQNAAVVQFFNQTTKPPATAWNASYGEVALGGIDYMSIEKNFKIS